MDRYALRREDYSLSEDQTDLQSAYQKFFKANCSIDVVRAAEASGFDKSLWERLCATGATSMALPESVGGDGATLLDLVLVAEEVGRSLAPVPWIDHVCAARLLARLGALDDREPIVSGESIIGLVLARALGWMWMDPLAGIIGARFEIFPDPAKHQGQWEIASL